MHTYHRTNSKGTILNVLIDTRKIYATLRKYKGIIITDDHYRIGNFSNTCKYDCHK